MLPRGSRVKFLAGCLLWAVATWPLSDSAYSLSRSLVTWLYSVMLLAESCFLLTNGNKIYSQYISLPTSPILFCLNKKDGFNFNVARLHMTKQVSRKKYSYNIYIYFILRALGRIIC